ncbi:hypothetical protein SUDANB176_03276 [Streptomyces sp. enrichment culture]|uniref:hypothetical protein n=1 Tax=Streptomyces sp. enrichment culture TaxID=1795815 RepID=UPI003F56D855
MFRSEYADVPPVELPLHEAVLGRAAGFGGAPAPIGGVPRAASGGIPRRGLRAAHEEPS